MRFQLGIPVPWAPARFLIGAATAAAVLMESTARAAVDYTRDVRLLFEAHCVKCHGPEKQKGGLRFDTREGAFKTADSGEKAIVPGHASQSLLIKLVSSKKDDERMPPKGDPLTKEQTEVLRLWIEQGAEWPTDQVLKQVKRIDFVKDIQPLLELNCVACHREGHDKGGLRLDVKSEAFKGGDNGVAIVPRRPKKSPLYTSTVLPPEHDDLMPPANKGGPLPKEQTDLLSSWIEQGAIWPDGMTLVPKKKEEIAGADEEQTVAEIHKLIMSRLKVTTESDMKPYTNTIPGTQVMFAMMPIPGGEFIMGSPANEPGRNADEGPQHKVKISPFWMAKCEITWDAYEVWMSDLDILKRQLAGIAANERDRLAAGLLPCGDHRTQGAGLAGTGGADQQPDALVSGKQLSDSSGLVVAEVVLDDGRLDDVAVRALPRWLARDVQQPGFLVEGGFQRPAMSAGLVVDAGAIRPLEFLRRVDDLGCGHTHQLRMTDRRRDEPLGLLLEVRRSEVSG